MIKIDKVQVMNISASIRGMRNAFESWDKSDSCYKYNDTDFSEASRKFIIGEKDLILASKLANSGTDDSKFLRQIIVSLDITAPLYWYKEFDTYKVGTVANSTSTMHLLGKRDLRPNDFSWDHVTDYRWEYLDHINLMIQIWRENKSEENFRWMIQDLSNSFNQTRTITLNYAVLRNQYHARKCHKLEEWRDYCDWIKTLPYAKELICFEGNKSNNSNCNTEKNNN